MKASETTALPPGGHPLKTVSFFASEGWLEALMGGKTPAEKQTLVLIYFFQIHHGTMEGERKKEAGKT